MDSSPQPLTSVADWHVPVLLPHASPLGDLLADADSLRCLREAGLWFATWELQWSVRLTGGRG